MQKISKFLMSSVLVLGLISGSAMAQTIKVGTTVPEGGSPEHLGIVAFKEYVETRSDGRITVRLFPGGQLGNTSQLTEGVRDGTLEMAQVDDGALSTFVEGAQVFTLPYAFNSEPEAWELFQGDFRDKIADAIHEETGAYLLNLAVNGFRSITNSRRPIETVEDVEGLKIRVIPSQSYIRFVEALGGAATPIPAPELILSLQQGVVDGQENHPTVILNFGIADVQNYLTLTEHILGVHATIMNGDFFDGLSDDDRMIVIEGAKLQAAVQNVERVLQQEIALAEIAAKGVQIQRLSHDEKERFRSRTQARVREHLVSEIGEDWVVAFEHAIEAARTRLQPLHR